MKIAEGSVVCCPSKIKVEEKRNVEGTIWLIDGSDIYVLDPEGYIHKVSQSEIWEPQEGSK